METKIPYDLIGASFNSEISTDERQILDAWLKSSSQNKDLYLKLEKIWNESGRLETEFSPNAKDALKKVHNRIGVSELKPKNKNISLVRRTILLAAGVALLVGLSYILFPSKSETFLISSTLKNQKKELTIADGSIILLNRNSKLSYPSEFKGKQRKVKLEGEAYFEVAKDSLKPFIIESNGTLTTVLGTKFNLKAYSSDDSVIISLKEGKVRFAEINSDQKVILIPGEKALFIKSSKRISKFKIDNPNFLSWKTGTMEFNNTPMNIVSETMSDYFEKTIIIQDTSISKLRFTGTFKNPNLKNMLQSVEEALNVNSEVDSNKIVLTAK